MKIYLIFFTILWQFARCSNLNPVPFIHQKCQNTVYPKSNIERFNVSDELVCWNISYPGYNPKFYESETIQGKPWADPPIGEFMIEFCLNAKY